MFLSASDNYKITDSKHSKTFKNKEDIFNFTIELCYGDLCECILILKGKL